MKRREPASARIARHPAAIAQEKWTEANADLFNRATLGTNPQYLRNRLLHAFMDGWNACNADNGDER